MFKIHGKYTTAKVMIDNVDEATLSQIQRMTDHPSSTNPIAIMPDTHAGKGCVIGFTMRASETIVPNFIGVDIGCGMRSVKINVKHISNYQLSLLDDEIRKIIPMGRSINNITNALFNGIEFVKFLKYNASVENLNHFNDFSYADLSIILKRIGMCENKFLNSIGTLGGGNHFIEIGKDGDGYLWLTVHTGSRNFGNVVCKYFNNIAKKKLKKVDISDYIKDMKKSAKCGIIDIRDIGKLIEAKKKETDLNFNVSESAYLSGEDVYDYLTLMFIAQTYAKFNRLSIINKILNALSFSIHVDNDRLQLSIILCCKRSFKDTLEVESIETIESVHNFIDFSDNIIRKGAIRSYVGEKMIIPFNMRDGLLVCEGKSNPDWNFSAPHGAGRVSSRINAKRTISLDEYKKSMEGVFSTSVNTETIDESPMAYKDSELIENAIDPTATIIHRVKPIYNVKSN